MTEAIRWVPHSDKQEDALDSTAKITLVGTGIQWGKTSVGANRMARAMHTYVDPKDAFIITAPTYKIMMQSTLPAFLAVMGAFGSFNKSDSVFKTHWGSICYFRTETDPDSIVGITNVRHIWGDEAGKYGLYFWENIQARAAFRNCPIDLTTSPYALNWIYKEIVRPKMKDRNARPDVKWIAATSAENPYFPMEEYERRKLTMDPRRFAALYGGRWEKMSGLVYDCFDEVENICDPFTLPTGTNFYGGVDWGYTAPFVLKVRAVTPDNLHYGVYEFYKTGQTLAQKLDVARQAKAIFGVKVFYCDPEDPASIAAFNEAKLTAVSADNDIRAGIDDHYELIKTRRFKLFKGSSPYSIDEYESYHYPDPDDIGPDQSEKEVKPVKQGDHAMDVDRYLSRALRRGGILKRAVSPSDEPKQVDQFARLARLRRPSGGGNTESW